MLVELKDGTVKDLHYTIASKLIKKGKAKIYEGERLKDKEEKPVKAKPKGRPKKAE